MAASRTTATQLRRRLVAAGRGGLRVWPRLSGIAVLLVLAAGSPADAEPLDQQIPNLFGGKFITSVSPFAGRDSQQGLVSDRYKSLSASLAVARSQVPVPSASGAFRFEFDDEDDTYVRRVQSLGPSIAERAQTLGARTGSLSFAYSHIDFDTLEGDSLNNLRSSQPSLTAAFVAQLPPLDQQRVKDDTLDTQLRLKFGLDLFFVTAAYGVTDKVDVSMALSFGRAHMQATANATINPGQNGKLGSYFTIKQQGVVRGGTGNCSTDFTCASDGFDSTAWGTGDVYLRAKWHVHDYEWADLAVSSIVTIPTGNADDYLGFQDPTFTPWFIASKTFGRISPHINLGYAFRSGGDVSQAQWIAGADLRVTDWLTGNTDFLGYHDDKRDGISDDIYQSAVGFKINPFGQFVLAGTFQFPLNRDGLRADVIYSGQLEYTF